MNLADLVNNGGLMELLRGRMGGGKGMGGPINSVGPAQFGDMPQGGYPAQPRPPQDMPNQPNPNWPFSFPPAQQGGMERNAMSGVNFPLPQDDMAQGGMNAGIGQGMDFAKPMGPGTPDVGFGGGMMPGGPGGFERGMRQRPPEGMMPISQMLRRRGG